MSRPVVVGVLSAAAVLIWPRVGRGRWGRERPWAPWSEVTAWVDRWRNRLPGGASRRSERREQALLSAIDALPPALSSGLTPAQALAAAAEVSPDPGLRRFLADVGTAIADGHRPGEALASVAWGSGDSVSVVGPGGSSAPVGLGVLIRAWRVGEDVGAPLAEATQTVSGIMRADLARSRALTASLAEARATVRVLVALPVCGPGLALAVGASPAALYASPAGAGCLLGGLVLVVIGRWWMQRLVAGVADVALLT